MGGRPFNQKMIRAQNDAEIHWDDRDEVGEQRAQSESKNNPNHGDTGSLPEENGGDIFAFITHGTQDGDLLGFLHDGKRQDIKDAEAREKNDHRNDDSSRNSQGIE